MAVDYYLKIDGIEGEATNTNHKGEIQLLSYSWGGTQTSSVGISSGSGAGKVDLAHLAVMKHLDKASVKLFKAMCAGTHIANAVLTAIKAGSDNKPFLTVTLGELFVTSLQLSGSSELPSESVSFSYNQIKIEYSTQDANGNLTVAGSANYNLNTGVAS
jgi:type VI secretion system secreted protein Hcp